MQSTKWSAVLPLLPDPANYMRLFCMQSGEPTGEIHGSFKVVQIGLLPAQAALGYTPYIALSHCWGPSKDSLIIWVDGKPLRIRQTLHEALLKLRSTTTRVSLWADQICIAQDDLDERSQQIQRMDHIFQLSDLVIAWLGPTKSLSDQLFSILQSADLRDTIGEMHFPSAADDHDRWVRICECRFLGGPRWSTPWSHHCSPAQLFTALITLFRRPYFRRVWTIQECVLAPRLILQAGDVQLESTVLTTILRDLVYINHSCMTNLHAEDNIMRPSAIFELRAIWSRYLSTPASVSGLDTSGILNISKQRFCQDDRDRVYGLLGILDHINPEFRREIKTDYRMPVENLYMQTMQTLLKQGSSMEALRSCCAMRERPRHNLPSWCDDWSSLADCTAHNYRSVGPGPAKLTTGKPMRFSGRCDLRLRSLAINGVVVDEIEAVHTHAHGTPEQMWLDWFLFLEQDTLAHVPVLCKLLLARHDPAAIHLERATSELRMSLADSSTTTFRGEFGSYTMGKFLGRDEYTSPLETEPLSRMDPVHRIGVLAPQDSRMIEDALSTQTLFRTRRGKFGTSCRHVAVGDSVCFLDGGAHPFLIRKVQPSALQPFQTELLEKHSSIYQLIGGECRVYDLENGEIQDTAGVKEDTICLV